MLKNYKQLEAEKIIQHAIKELYRLVFQPAPRVVMHQLEKNEGGQHKGEKEG